MQKVQKTNSQRVVESRKKNSDSILLTVPKGQRNILKLKAEQENMSLNQWIQKAIEYYIQKSD